MIGIDFSTPRMMSMLNQAAVEALCSATYLENYLDCMENLPDDLQRVVSQLRELDSLTNDILQDLTHHQEVYMREGDGAKKQRALLQIQRGLIKSQEVGDEKLQLVTLIVELIENRTRQLEQDLENLDPCAADIKEEKTVKVEPSITNSTKSYKTTAVQQQQVAQATPSTPAISHKDSEMSIASSTASAKSKRQRRQRTEVITKEEEKKEEEEKPKKKKKRKVKKDKGIEKANIEPIDPDEPTYCLCDQISYGEMIGCDYDKCEIEWFHFNCVSLTTKPKGKWYCPKCRGDKPTVKRADLK